MVSGIPVPARRLLQGLELGRHHKDQHTGEVFGLGFLTVSVTASGKGECCIPGARATWGFATIRKEVQATLRCVVCLRSAGGW